MYFENFPLILYDSVGNGNFKVVTNLLKRVAVRSKVKTNVSVFDTYDIKEGETPEMLADKLYDDPELHWVILLMNDITDRYHQWPKNYNQFLAYVNDKYSNPILILSTIFGTFTRGETITGSNSGATGQIIDTLSPMRYVSTNSSVFTANDSITGGTSGATSAVDDTTSGVDGTHHYEISQVSGDTTIKIDIGTDNTDYPAASIVTNYEYEEDLQDKKRKIRLLDPEYVENFVDEFEKLMGESVR